MGFSLLYADSLLLYPNKNVNNTHTFKFREYSIDGGSQES